MTLPNTKQSIVALVILGLITVSVPSTTYAQTYNQSFQPQNTEELIAYLQGVIAQLQAQLAMQRGQTVQTTATVATYGIGSGYYGGQVLGASTQNSNYYQTTNYSSQDLYRDYSVRLSRVDARELGDESAEFKTTINFNDAPYIDVWFEYGPNGYLGENTRKERIYSNGNQSRTYRKTVSNLDGDEYDFGFVRVVAEIPNGRRIYTLMSSFTTDDDNHRRNYNDDEPDVDTGRATNIDDNEAVIDGEVDMNDFRNGLVFFVYGEDEDLVEEIEDEYDEFRDIDEDGDDLQKVRVDSDLDGDEEYRLRISGLDNDTEYFYQICVEFEDEDDDETIICGGVEDFETDR